jgi:nitric oxide reductase NorQ protein
MAWRLGRPLVTVSCNEDMSAGDLLGRWLIDDRGTHWRDGPLTLAARHGAICYLDEIVEARQDTPVAIHPLADSRRVLPLDRNNELIHAHPDFHLVISYNPGYQGVLKDLKMSTRQRFTAIEFDYPPAELEARVLAHEAGITAEQARRLVDLGERTRRLKGHGLEEGASTRMLIHAGALIARGIEPIPACRMGIVEPIADDPDVTQALNALVDAIFA